MNFTYLYTDIPHYCTHSNPQRDFLILSAFSRDAKESSPSSYTSLVSKRTTDFRELFAFEKKTSKPNGARPPSLFLGAGHKRGNKVCRMHFWSTPSESLIDCAGARLVGRERAMPVPPFRFAPYGCACCLVERACEPRRPLTVLREATPAVGLV